MLREELYFIDKPTPSFVHSVYGTGSIAFDEVEKAWTFTTTAASSYAYGSLSLGECNFGDKVIVECEVDNVTGQNAFIGLNDVAANGSVSAYTGFEVSNNDKGKKKRIVLQIQKKSTLNLYVGMNYHRIGSAKVKNIQVKKITDTSNMKSNVDKLIASIRKNSSTGTWEVIPNRGSNPCAITQFNASYLQLTFSESLGKTNSIAFVGMDYGTPNYIIRSGNATKNSVMIEFRRVTDNVVETLANVQNGTSFNVRIE